MVAKRSGVRLGKADIPIVLGMIARDDRRHDIAAWFGVNPGRVKGAENGDNGTPDAANAADLPPSGPPGLKGRRLRAVVDEAIKLLAKGDAAGAEARLNAGIADFDAHEG